MTGSRLGLGGRRTRGDGRRGAARSVGVGLLVMLALGGAAGAAAPSPFAGTWAVQVYDNGSDVRTSPFPIVAYGYFAGYGGTGVPTPGIVGFNVAGPPVFHRLVAGQVLNYGITARHLCVHVTVSLSGNLSTTETPGACG